MKDRFHLFSSGIDFIFNIFQAYFKNGYHENDNANAIIMIYYVNYELNKPKWF